MSVWNLCHSGTVKGKSSLSLSAPKGQRQEKSIKILVFRVWMGRTRCLLHICGSGKEEDEHEFNFPASWVKYMARKQSTRLVSLLCLCVSMEKGPMSGIEYYSGKTADFWPPQEMQWWWISFCMVGASSWQPQFSTGLQGFSIKKTISDTCRRILKAFGRVVRKTHMCFGCMNNECFPDAQWRILSPVV